MIGLLLIIIAILAMFFVFLIFQSLGGKLVGAQIEEIGLFNGPALLSFKLGGIKLRLNSIPLGSYVKFAESFENLAVVKKIFVVLAGLVSYILVAIAGLGLAATISQISKGFVQIFEGAWSPLAVGSKFIEALAVILKDQSFLTGTSILACKFFALNALPVGAFSGGMLIVYLLELCGFKSLKFNERFQLIGILLLVLIFFPWLIGFAAFVWKSLAL